VASKLDMSSSVMMQLGERPFTEGTTRPSDEPVPRILSRVTGAMLLELNRLAILTPVFDRKSKLLAADSLQSDSSLRSTMHWRSVTFQGSYVAGRHFHFRPAARLAPLLGQ
jgi:hypothetical protein